MSKILSIDQAWKMLLNKYNIVENVNENGIFYIKSSQIREYKEPRLMAKWDSSENLPQPLKNNNLNILPVSRSEYAISDFKVYANLPELDAKIENMPCAQLETYETIDIHSITSESTAINILLLSRILNNFLEVDDIAATFNGRMGTPQFEFLIDTHKNIKRSVAVKNAQCEIDGGFETNDSVIILEAKNIVHPDFNVRQLYYPYRLWASKVKKPVRLVFSIYSNMIYRLFEYKFENIGDYSSIILIRNKNYSLQDTTITIEDLQNIKKSIGLPQISDESGKDNVPFIQADSVDRIISLLENMYNHPMTPKQIIDLMGFVKRQYRYYVNAGKYLGLFEDCKIDGVYFVQLSSIGNKICKMNYKERQLKLVELMLNHAIFFHFFEYIYKNGAFPTVNEVCKKMLELHIFDVNNSTVARRAQTVISWLKWIYTLTKL